MMGAPEYKLLEKMYEDALVKLRKLEDIEYRYDQLREKHGTAQERIEELETKLKDTEGDHRQIHGLQDRLERAERSLKWWETADPTDEKCLCEEIHRDGYGGLCPSCKVKAHVEAKVQETNRLINELRNALVLTHDCATLRGDGTCDGCRVSELLGKTEKRNDLLPIPPPLTVDIVVPDGKCWLCRRAATGKKGAEPRCDAHL